MNSKTSQSKSFRSKIQELRAALVLKFLKLFLLAFPKLFGPYLNILQAVALLIENKGEAADHENLRLQLASLALNSQIKVTDTRTHLSKGSDSHNLLAYIKSDSNYFSFSQEGEDLILADLFSKVETGFYLDVGAHHPFRYSNTALLYFRNWSGICIDPLPSAAEDFRVNRPRDIFVNAAVGISQSWANYFMFSEPALNTFDSERAENLDKTSPFKIIRKEKVPVVPLESLLNRYLKKDQSIDLFNLDVEGNEMSVLSSINWTHFRPKYILAEDLDADLLSLKDQPVTLFLLNKGYHPFAKTKRTVFYRDEKLVY